jgi:tetratricopeptide (TPR) repeat protein
MRHAHHETGSRLALRLVLVAWLALILSAGFGTPASAQKNEVAALNAGIAGDLRESARSGASRGRDPLEQSRSGRQGRGPLCRRRATDQAVACDSRKSARTQSSRCREVAEQSRADLFERQGHYADAEPLYQRAVAIRERALGSDHPDLWTSLNNLAFLYQAEGRTPDVLPLVERTIASGHAQLRVALPVLSAAPRQQLMPAEQALDDALNAVQRAGARAVLTGSRSRGNRRRFAGARMSTRPSGALTALPFRPAVWGPCVDRRGGGPIGRECAPQHLRYGG